MSTSLNSQVSREDMMIEKTKTEANTTIAMLAFVIGVIKNSMMGPSSINTVVKTVVIVPSKTSFSAL